MYAGSRSVGLVNSATHVWGYRTHETRDSSTNLWWVALLTFGEGWHNNHHYYQRSTNQGFFWWEIDPTFYVLKALSWVGLVWDLHTPPPHVLNSNRVGAVKPVQVEGALTAPVLEPVIETPAE